jgi:hypothetical protein
MNKIKRDATQGILDEYIVRGIKETSTSAWNVPAFLVKKQHGPEETLVSKRWPVVEDYWQLNTTILDEVFVPPCVQELPDIVGNDNKYFCSIDLRQGCHHIPLKASDRKKTAFSTRGLAGKLQSRVLQYGLKHGRQIFQRTMERSLTHLYIDVALYKSMTFSSLKSQLRTVY